MSPIPSTPSTGSSFQRPMIFEPIWTMDQPESQQEGKEDDSPDRKRARLKDDSEDRSKQEAKPPPDGDGEQRNESSAFQHLQQVLLTSECTLPESLATDPPIQQDSQRLQNLLKDHGFRTTLVTSPRPGVSIYKDSAVKELHLTARMVEGRRFLLIMLGLAVSQKELEEEYKEKIRPLWCLSLFCQKIRKAYFPLPSGEDGDILLESLESELKATENVCRQFLSSTDASIDSFDERVATLISHAVEVKNLSQRFQRAEEWEREYQRIFASNCSLANLHLVMFLSHHQMWIHDVVFKQVVEAKFERMTFFLYDRDADDPRPRPFLFLPSLHTILDMGIQSTVSTMVESLWSNLLQLGYFVTEAVKMGMTNHLIQFFVCGFLDYNQTSPEAISSLPLSLRARFDPTFPLSAYLYGMPGSGKSSFARLFPIALEETLMQFADPECVVRIVKQNLNKKMEDLELELELRPNNNDMSLMSIIQSRKQKMSQSKRGLVILNLEEMPRFDSRSDPDQLSAVRLIKHRFGGHKGDYRRCHSADPNSSGNGEQRARNSGRHSIGDDCSLITIFTSNYTLREECKKQLRDLRIFQEIAEILVFPLAGKNRETFAMKYFATAFEKQDRGRNHELCKDKLELRLKLGEGDVRPVIKTLRIIAFYFSLWLDSELYKEKISNRAWKVTKIRIKQTGGECSISLFFGAHNSETLELLEYSDGFGFCWFPKILNDHSKSDEVVNMWKAKALAPVVLLSSSKEKSEELMNALATDSCCHCVRDVHVDRYKVSRSLYDPKDTPNLRDDILKFGRGALVAVELVCSTEHSQLLAREMIEDSPSMTAFSSPRSALYKDGLLFVLNVQGYVTPEVASRVSFEL